MNLFNTHINPAAIKLVTETLGSGWISEGKRVAEFEQALHERLHLSHPVTVNSGTSALHLALACQGIGPGDECILPAQTFIATALAILYCGATPVFADIDPLTGVLEWNSVIDRITDKTRAIIPVAWAGYPPDRVHLGQIRPNIAIIEDAAQALGATYNHTPVGVSGITCFSLQATKHLTTGDGGIICTDDTELAEKHRKYRWFGIDREKNKPNELGERQYSLTEIGFKYHMNDIAASIGLGNLERFSERIQRRVKIAHEYGKALRKVPGLTLMHYKRDRTSAYWAYPILVDWRESFVRKMHGAGIPVSVIHQRIDKHPLFGGLRQDLPGQDYFDSHQVHIPCHDGLGDDDVEFILKTIGGGW